LCPRPKGKNNAAVAAKAKGEARGGPLLRNKLLLLLRRKAQGGYFHPDVINKRR